MVARPSAVPPVVPPVVESVPAASTQVSSATGAEEMLTSRISSPVLVGRADELASLEGLLEAALAGNGRAVLLSGEAGVGKTRLVGHLSEKALARGVRVLSGGSVDFGEGSLPFGAVTDALRPLPALLGPARLDGLLVGGRAELSRVLPELGSAPPPQPVAQADPHDQARLFELLLRLLETVARETGVLLVLDDLHWADPSTREFFAFLCRNIGRSRILAVGTYRSDELHRTHPLRRYVTTLVAARRAEHIELERLDADRVREQVEAILGRAPEAGVVEQLYARSLGNPFFTEELLGGSVRPGRLPSTLRDTLLGRVEQVSRRARDVLDALAVLGRPADEPLLTAVSGLEPAAVAAAVREAAERHVLVRVGTDDLRWSFRHALVQEAIYDDLLGSERARLHRAVAEALEATASVAGRAGLPGAAGLDAELAHHFRRGHEPARALAAAARAARAATARYAYPEALQDWEQVLELWEQVPDPAASVGIDHPGVLGEAAQVATAAGSHRRSISLIGAAIGEVDAEREPLRAALGQAFLMIQLFSAGDAAGADSAREAALALIEREPPGLDHVRVLNMCAYPPLFASRYADVAAAGTRALAIAERLGATTEAALARIPLGIAVSFLGRVAEGDAHLRDALSVARQAGHPWAIADAYLALGIVREAAGRFDDALAIMAEGVRVLADYGIERTHAATLRINMAEALRRLGEWREALGIVERELSREGTGWEIAHGSVLKGHLLAAMGRHDESAQALDTAWRHFGRAGTGFVGHYHVARAENALWHGETSAALGIAVAGVAEIRATGDLRWIGELVVLGTRAAAELGTAPGADLATAVSAADGLLGDLRAATEEAEASGTIFGREVSGYMATATAERARLDRDDARALWRAAADTWKALGQPYPQAYALFRAAEASLTAGDRRDAAAGPLAETAAIARDLGASPLLDAVEGLARRARVALPGDGAAAQRDPGSIAAEPGATLGLTQREREVLALLGEGRSDQEIAEALFISAKTASVHVSNIKAKLGVDRRVEAALLAARIVGRGTAS